MSLLQIDAMQLVKSEKILSEQITRILKLRPNVTTSQVIDSFASTQIRMFCLARQLKYSKASAEELMELAAAIVCFHARTMQEENDNVAKD